MYGRDPDDDGPSGFEVCLYLIAGLLMAAFVIAIVEAVKRLMIG